MVCTGQLRPQPAAAVRVCGVAKKLAMSQTCPLKMVRRSQIMADNIPHFAWKIPPGKWAVKKKFVGAWRIIEFEGFDAEYVDLCAPAIIKISSGGIGQMNFGAVEMELDCKMDDLNEQVVRFSFEGDDEGDPISGHGYCLNENHALTGRIFRHCGDEISFKAQRIAKDGKA
jgi:hypothetical protein